MRRELMNFIDPQVILFNGRGFVHVKEDSMTGFGWPVFPPVDLRSYDFHLNILDNASGTIIRDDVPAMWKQWKETGTGTDRAFQDLSSMPTELSAGAGLEAVWFGVFGLQPQMDGSLLVSPAWNSELGNASLKNFRFRNHSYDITLTPTRFEVHRDGQPVGNGLHGTSLIMPAHII